MKNMLTIPTNNIADVINQSSHFRESCDAVKSELADIRRRIAISDQRVLDLESAIATHISSEVRNYGSDCAINVSLYLDLFSQECVLTLRTTMAVAGGTKDIFNASVEFHHNEQDVIFLNQRIKLLVDDGPCDQDNEVDSFINVDTNAGIADVLVDSALACRTFIKATINGANSALNVLVTEYINERKLNRQLNSELYERLDTYASQTANAFANVYRRVTQAEIQLLWDAPVGTELRYLEISAQKHRESSNSPKVYFRFQPYTISVAGEGAERKLVNSKKHGYSSMIARKLDGMTIELLNGTFAGDPNVFVLHRGVLVDETVHYDLLNINIPTIVDL